MAEPIKIKKKTKLFKMEDFMSQMESGYNSQIELSSFKTKKSFGPSTIGYQHGTCPRYWYYAFHGVTFEDEGGIQSVANRMNGTDAHARIQRIMAVSGIDFDAEIMVKHADPPILGFIDGLLKYDDKTVVLEIKTTREEVFGHYKMLSKCSPAHLLQTLIYMYLTGSPEGVILYENKNTLELVAVPVLMSPRNKKYVEDVFGWMREVKTASDENLLPMKKFTNRSKTCKYCPLKKTCHADTAEPKADIEPLVVQEH